MAGAQTTDGSGDPGWEALMIATSRGDAVAFEALVRAADRELRLVVARWAWSRRAVDEIMQDAWLDVWNSRATYRPGGDPGAWLRAVAANRVRMAARRRRRDPRADPVEDLLAREAAATAEGETPVAKRLEDCLGRLTGPRRRLVERRYRDGLPLAVLAQEFRRKTGTIAVILHRIRTALRRCIEAAP